MNVYEGPMDGSKKGRSEGGRWAWVEWVKVVVGNWRQLYSNINKKFKNSERKKTNIKECLAEENKF